MTELVAVCGAPGVGKSRVATYIGNRLNATVLQTDAIRKELFPEPRYTSDESQIVYDTLFHRAEQNLLSGKDVVLDGTFSLRRGRERVVELADEPFINQTIIKVTCVSRVAKERIREREDISDATPEIHDSIKESFESIQRPHFRLDNSEEWEETVYALERRIMPQVNP